MLAPSRCDISISGSPYNALQHESPGPLRIYMPRGGFHLRNILRNGWGHEAGPSTLLHVAVRTRIEGKRSGISQRAPSVR